MQTCPLCQNAFVSRTCCTDGSFGNAQFGPFLPHCCHQVCFTLTPGLCVHQNQQNWQPHIVSTNAESVRESHPLKPEEEEEEERTPPDAQLPSLPTPNVSGHMFHFPSLNTELADRLSVCHLNHQVNCLQQGAHFYPPASCTDSSFYQNMHRRRTSNVNYFRSNNNNSGTNSNSRCGVGVPVNHLAHKNFEKSLINPEDIRQLEASENHLKESYFYWENLSWQEAEVLLQPTSVGTFLMRNSSDRNHRFSLSVQTERGPTSVRINFNEGKFRLKCEDSVRTTLPKFSCVIKLIEYYISSNEKYNNHVWIDASGKVYSPIKIIKPLYTKVPSLKHFCRKSVNHSYTRQDLTRKVAVPILQYLDEYPYWC
ncbi:UNVERIFIED_CONTAM: hypothetical protein RMT77_011407 [Armadillidium vulgare]